MLGFLKFSLLAPQLSKIVQRCGDIDTVAAVLFFLQAERFRKPLLGKLQPALRPVDFRDVVERDRDHDIRLPRRFPENLQRAAEDVERLFLPQLTVTEIAERHARQRRRQMVGTKGLLVDADRAQRVAFGVLQAVLAERDLAERGEHSGNVRVIWAERLLADGKRPSQYLFSLGGLALGLQRLRQHDERHGRQGRLRARCALGVRRQLSRQADRFAVAALLRQRRDTAHQRQHVLRIGLAVRRNDA